MNAHTIVISAIVVVVAVFILQNTMVIDVRFFFWKVSMSRALVLLGTFGVGLLMGWMLGALRKGDR